MERKLRKTYNKSFKKFSSFVIVNEKQVTIRMGQDVISYFKAMSEDTGIPYQSLINLYLKDCVSNHRKINLSWAEQA